MVVKNVAFDLYFEEFTPDTFMIVVIKDNEIEQEEVMLNIKIAREYFT